MSIVDKLIDKALDLIFGTKESAKLEEPLGELETEKVKDELEQKRLERQRRHGSR